MRKLVKRAKLSLRSAEDDKDALESELQRRTGELEALRSRTKDDSKDVKRLRRDLRIRDENLELLNKQHAGLAESLSDFHERLDAALSSDEQFQHVFRDRKFAYGKFLVLLNQARKRIETYERQKKKSRELSELKQQMDASKSLGSSSEFVPAGTRDSSQSTAVGNFAAFFDAQG